MRRSVMMSFFILIFASVILSCHAYVAWRLVSSTAMPGPWAQVVWTLFMAAAILAPVGLATSRALPMAIARPVLTLLYAWLGTFFLLFCLTVAVDLVLGLMHLYSLWAGPHSAPDLARRTTMLRFVRGGQTVVALGAAWQGHRTIGQGAVSVQVPIHLARFPAAMNGFKIVQISDLHVAPLLGREYVAQVVARVMAHKPDLIAITGDLVDGSVADLKDSVAPLASLKAAYGSYFITGNHEYYSGADAWLAEVRRLGITPLRNERVVIGTADHSFDLAGIDDWTAHQFGAGHGADLPKALAGRDPNRELILLAHQPKAIFEAEQHGVGLMLSGHTHGGQIWPFGLLVRLAQPFVRGLHTLGQSQIYVNRGTGFWGPPMRLGASPEITVLTLSRKQASV
jgi:predicted MPP superfamily phosphohydrolase